MNRAEAHGIGMFERPVTVGLGALVPLTAPNALYS